MPATPISQHLSNEERRRLHMLRREEIRAILQNRRATLAELAKKYNVKPLQIRKDIDALGMWYQIDGLSNYHKCSASERAKRVQSRREKIKSVLDERKYTSQELVSILGVTRQTIQRDIDVLGLWHRLDWGKRLGCFDAMERRRKRTLTFKQFQVYSFIKNSPGLLIGDLIKSCKESAPATNWTRYGVFNVCLALARKGKIRFEDTPYHTDLKLRRYYPVNNS